MATVASVFHIFKKMNFISYLNFLFVEKEFLSLDFLVLHLQNRYLIPFLNMTIGQTFVAELEEEAKATRKMLKLFLPTQAGWQPHEKSATLGALMHHVAEMPEWIVWTQKTDTLDFAVTPYESRTFESADALVAYFDAQVEAAKASLLQYEEAHFHQLWTMRNGEQVYFSLPRVVVLRSSCFNHWYHHRGQLTVYLRLLGIPVPATYGPTADFPDGM